MKSSTHQSTLHLSFKIKCCVDRLRPPPQSRHQLSPLRGPFRARSRSGTPYSITSSASPSSVGGILNPIVRAVLRLILSWNLVGNSTGRSDGFLPLSILSTNVAHW